MSTTTRYFWAVHYPKRPKDGAKVTKPQPAQSGAVPKSVYVYHIDENAPVALRFEVLRRSGADDPKYYRGAPGEAIEPPTFHPSKEAAIEWMDENWERLKAAGAGYAELHSFHLTIGQPAGG